MFIGAEDELIEIVEQLGNIEKQSPPLTTDASPTPLMPILTEHKHHKRHEHKNTNFSLYHGATVFPKMRHK